MVDLVYFFLCETQPSYLEHFWLYSDPYTYALQTSL